MPTRTKPVLERKVVRLVAMHTTYTDIAEQTGLSVSGVKKIAKRNRADIQVIRDRLLDSEFEITQLAKQRALNLIGEYLGQAAAGEIRIPLRELLAISHEMHQQSLNNPRSL